MQVENIRNKFAELLRNEEFVRDKSGCVMLEIIGAGFEADEDFIFGAPNEDYIQREIAWYESQSRSVYDIAGKTPKIWEYVSDENGMINSNYGWMIYSRENGSQYANVLSKLLTDPDTRQATMIYNRPSMHSDAIENGMSDFCCTAAVNFFIREGELECVVQMRSNDAWAGYRNDVAWHKHVQSKLVEAINTENGSENIVPGKIMWSAGTLHLYERQFYLVEDYTENAPNQ